MNEKEFAEVKSELKDAVGQLHDLKHASNNLTQQVDGIYKQLEHISKSMETFIQRYEGNAEIGYTGQTAEMKEDMEELAKKVNILMDAYEVGKVWKIKISGFFLALTGLAALATFAYGAAKVLVWIKEHINLK
jgi:uncharacterized protein YukE